MIKKNQQVISSQIVPNHEKIQTQKCVHQNNISKQYEQYLSKMPVRPLTMPQIYDKLSSEGFEYNQAYSFEFKSLIEKADDYSVTYLIEYGHFRRSFLAFVSRIEFHNVFYRKHLSSGKHGWTQCFQYNKNQIVAKVIQMQKVNGLIKEQILKELFITKIASVLGVGPKIINVYGYDIVMADRKVQFVMEKCKTKIFDKGKDKKMLLDGLSIIHSLNIIHGDLNSSNIMWSDLQKKHVFIDFGLSFFNKANIGEKSLSLFRGSYNFCYKEMQQAFGPQKAKPVDLYYNDLFGTQKFIETLNHKKQEILKTEKSSGINFFVKWSKISKNKHKIFNNWQILVNFFQINLMAYQQKYDQILLLVQNQKQLSNSFRMIAKRAISKIKQASYKQKLQSIYIKYKVQIEEIQKLDQNLNVDKFIFHSLVTKKSLTQQFFNQITFQNIDSIIKMGLFSKYWHKAQHKIQIFQILHQNNILGQCIDLNKQIQSIKFIISQINTFNAILPINQLDSYCEVLCSFRQFFHKTKNIKYLIIISDIFEFLHLAPQVQKTANIICQVFYEKQKNIFDYLMAAHNFLYRICFLHLSLKIYWQKLYVQKWLRFKQSLNSSQLLFSKLISLEGQNFEEIQKIANQIDYSTAEKQTYKHCIQIKAYYFKPYKEMKAYNFYKKNQESKLYSNREYLKVLSHKNKSYVYHNHPYKWKQKSGSISRTLKPFLFIDTLRQLDNFKVNNLNKFFFIIKSYYQLLTDKKLVHLSILCVINYYLSYCFQTIARSDRLQQLTQWMAKFYKLIKFNDLIKNNDYIIRVFESLFYTYKQLETVSRLIDFAGKKIIDTFKMSVKQALQLCLDSYNKIATKQQREKILMKGYRMLLEFNQSKGSQQIQNSIKTLFIFMQKQNPQTKQLYFYFFYIFYLKSQQITTQLSENQKIIIRENLKSQFLKAFELQICRNQENLPLDIILRMLYTNQESNHFFYILVRQGDALKNNKISYSLLSSTSVRIFVSLDCFYFQRKIVIFSWQLFQVNQNPYKSAFVLNYLNHRFIKSLTHKQIQRLLILCSMAINGVDFGQNNIEQEIRLWNYIRKYGKNKKYRKIRKVLFQIVRRWCRYMRQLSQTQIYHQNQKQFLQLRQKLRVRKKKCLQNDLLYQVQRTFNKKIKRLKKYNR